MVSCGRRKADEADDPAGSPFLRHGGLLLLYDALHFGDQILCLHVRGPESRLTVGHLVGSGIRVDIPIQVAIEISQQTCDESSEEVTVIFDAHRGDGFRV